MAISALVFTNCLFWGCPSGCKDIQAVPLKGPGEKKMRPLGNAQHQYASFAPASPKADLELESNGQVTAVPANIWL